MIDELELAFDEHADRGRPRHRRGAAARSRRRGAAAARPSSRSLMVLVLLGGLGGGVWYGYRQGPGLLHRARLRRRRHRRGARSRSSRARPLTDIGNTLVEADVVKSAEGVRRGGRGQPAQQEHPARHLQAAQADARRGRGDAAARPEEPGRQRRHHPRGPDRQADATTCSSKATGIPVADFEAAAKDPIALGVPDFWFNRTDGKKVDPVGRGLPVPGDVRVRRRTPPPTQILETMVSQFLDRDRGDRLRRRRCRASASISPYEALIVASLAQAEAGIPRTSARSPGWPTTGSTAELPVQLPAVRRHGQLLAASSPASRPSRPSDMTAAELNDPKNPYNTRRASRACRPARSTTRARRRWRARWSPPDGRLAATSWRSTSRATRRSPTTIDEHDANIADGRARTASL